MTTFGLDYTSGPSIDILKSVRVDGNPVSFVCRYLSAVNAETIGKLLTSGEAIDLSRVDIAIVSNYEWYAKRATEGSSSGVQDAHIAASQHASCGGPPDRPIYFSVDVDVDGSKVVEYFKGVASVLGLHRTGAYGSYRMLKYLFDTGLIAWGWQTYAWSYGAWDVRAHIQQYQNSMDIGGHSVDYNRSMHADFGQWKIGGEQTVKIDIHTPGVGDFFTEQADGSWLCKHTGKTLASDVLKFYQGFGGSELCGLTWLGLPVSFPIPITGRATRQHFECGVVCDDPDRVIDKRPGGATVYLLHLYSPNSPGADPRVASLQQDNATLQAQVTPLQAQITQLQSEIASQPPAGVPTDVQAKLDHDASLLSQMRTLLAS